MISFISFIKQFIRNDVVARGRQKEAVEAAEEGQRRSGRGRRRVQEEAARRAEEAEGVGAEGPEGTTRRRGHQEERQEMMSICRSSIAIARDKFSFFKIQTNLCDKSVMTFVDVL